MASVAGPPYDRRVNLEIRPLTPALWDDLAELFAEGGDPRWCWFKSGR